MTSIVLAVVVAAALGWALRYFVRLAPVAAGYKAKVLCSAMFVSRRDIDPRFAPDVSADSYRILRLFRARVDHDLRTVTCSWLGLWPRTAIYRPGLGATLMVGPSLSEPIATGPMHTLPTGEASVRPRANGSDPGSVSEKYGHAPGGARGAFLERAPGNEPDVLGRTVDAAFTEPAPRKPWRTRAVLVLHDGAIVAERYAQGFGPDSALPGWSVTKSVLSALVGILVEEKRLSLQDKALLPEWRFPDDQRAAISVEDLLRMRSGLAFSEIYSDPRADVTQMLYASSDMAAFAANKPLSAPPGTTWHYSSGTTNILSRIVRQTVGEREYHTFPPRALFGPLGMNSAVMESDAAGTFVGSSYMFATARDWARFGQLYLEDGAWGGRRILPAGWVRLSATPTPQSPDGCYGAHWWLKVPRELGGETEAASRIPRDAFFGLGHEGQSLTVIPSRRLVVVRLGLSIHVDAWNHARFIADVVQALST
jgi:CubicO group peptidase (beta-lactamase class C family)